MRENSMTELPDHVRGALAAARLRIDQARQKLDRRQPPAKVEEHRGEA